ncbi:unnamed protein product [Oikopleura dioica]|uniref:TRUD domain-containing protein n=1 Tax=Oikopleura dioica TaxID=34765 RepID=E4YQ65_OIKDI|nr:unnamed protein product [Oikopleura dioica]
MLKEKDAGITQFRSENPSLKGIIKHRWSDFHVREIGLDGSVAKLTEFGVPKREDEVENEEAKIEVLTEKQLMIISSFVEDSMAEKEGEALIDFPENCDKELRTQYHKQIKQQFKNLETFTLKEENRLKVKWVKKGERGDRRNKRRDPKKKDEKFKFVLWKENMDTTAAVDHLCRILRVNQKLFNFAGTKDKRAITAQFVTSKLTPEVLVVANKKLKNVKVGNFELLNADHLTLGDLKGNEFNIVLRECELISGTNDEPESKKAKPDFEATVAKACASLNDKGFVNYYGLQRFGTSSIATHEIGVEILKENYAGAVDLLLRPREESARNSFLTETRKIWAETKNANAALDKLPRKYCNEGRVLFGLKDNPNDYVGALGRLARPMRQMYVHAVQSFIWNRLASFRLSLGGDILVGDLVQPNEREKLKVERVDEENIKNHSIEDVVISMPGFDVCYSPLLEDFMDKELESLGLTRDSFSGNVKDYRLPGGYRKLIVLPKDAEANVIMYVSNEENLLVSEREEFREEMGEGLLGDKNMGKEGEKVKVGISLKIKLPPSAYATMALREFMHCDQFE